MESVMLTDAKDMSDITAGSKLIEKRVVQRTLILKLPNQKPIKLWKTNQKIPPILHDCRLQKANTNDIIFAFLWIVDVERVEK